MNVDDGHTLRVTFCGLCRVSCAFIGDGDGDTDAVQKPE